MALPPLGLLRVLHQLAPQQALRFVRLLHETLYLPVPLAQVHPKCTVCLLYTSDAADERSSVDLGGRRIIKKNRKKKKKQSQGQFPR